jgi:hypothetical protein
MPAVPKVMRLPTAAECSPSKRPRQAATAVVTIAPIGARRRSTRRRNRDPGSASSRAIEYIVRAVTVWAAIPHARNAASTTAANGFADHDPNDASTEVATGSESSPATTPRGRGARA